MLAEVALNVERLDTLKPVLKPAFAPFQQGQYCTKKSRIHQLMVNNLCKNSKFWQRSL